MDFLKDRRFSFKLGGVDAWETEYTCTEQKSGTELTTVYCFKDGLKITNKAKKYSEFGAYEWVNYIENTSNEPTEIISELWDCAVELPMEHEEDRAFTAYLPDSRLATKVYAPKGSNWDDQEFQCDVDCISDNYRVFHLEPNCRNSVKRYSSCGGRSSNGMAPFFNIHKNGAGYIFAIGWSGQWLCEINRSNDTVTFRSKIEDTEFRVMPGESFRTSSVVMLPYKASFEESQNIWRRLVKAEFSQIGNAQRGEYGPFSAMLWGGMRSSSVIERIDKMVENRLPFEYVWMDAGWYGIDTKPTPDEFEGDWWAHNGDWRVSPLVHPNGLKDISKKTHDIGMKLLLWFEPERVVRGTPITAEHPDYLLSDGSPDCYNFLFDLGNSEAWSYLFNELSEAIENLKVDCFRNDFNITPLGYWRNADKAERKGIVEIKYINGLYRLWDSLLEKFPNLIIDDCASGGRRIDIEMLRRSIPLWRSDALCPANYDVEAIQCHSLGFNRWMPYSGTGTGHIYDEYRIRSSYSAALTVAHSFSEKEGYCDTEEHIAFLKKYTNEYLKVRPYFSEDFYALTEYSNKLDVWCAMQFNRPSEQDGLLEVFVRENAPYKTASFRLKGLDTECDYRFTDLDGGAFTVSGKELSEKGIELTIPEKRKAKLYLYKAI